MDEEGRTDIQNKLFETWFVIVHHQAIWQNWHKKKALSRELPDFPETITYVYNCMCRKACQTAPVGLLNHYRKTMHTDRHAADRERSIALVHILRLTSNSGSLYFSMTVLIATNANICCPMATCRNRSARKWWKLEYSGHDSWSINNDGIDKTFQQMLMKRGHKTQQLHYIRVRQTHLHLGWCNRKEYLFYKYIPSPQELTCRPIWSLDKWKTLLDKLRTLKYPADKPCGLNIYSRCNRCKILLTSISGTREKPRVPPVKSHFMMIGGLWRKICKISSSDLSNAPYGVRK